MLQIGSTYRHSVGERFEVFGFVSLSRTISYSTCSTVCQYCMLLQMRFSLSVLRSDRAIIRFSPIEYVNSSPAVIPYGNVVSCTRGFGAQLDRKGIWHISSVTEHFLVKG